MQIQVRINEEGALRNQRYAFTDRFTLVSELLQNARRAGASSIEVRHDAATQVLEVQDDGCGVDDFQKLLSFHESGWDAATSAEEHPFGVGFAKCLYAATRCIVASGRWCVDIDTAAALARTAIDVIEAEDAVPGTWVTLHGVDLPELANRIETVCQGFPLPVLFNGRPLMRQFAAAHLATMPSAIGAVHLAGARDGQPSHHTLVFLQGFCVMKPGYYADKRVNVVHLDSRQFTARLPDRDKLIDEDQQRQKIDAELKACWRRTLMLAKGQMPPERFVDTYYPAMRAWGHLDLLNDLDELPGELFDAIAGYPIQDAGGDRSYLAPVAVAPSRTAIECGAVTLIDLDGVDENNAARWMLARAQGHLVFDWVGLHAEHWAQRHVRFLDEASLEIEAVGETLRIPLEGRWVYPTVILCQAVRIEVGAETVEIIDAGVCHEDVLYIPAGERTGEAVRQASSFTDGNDQFHESDLDADRDALAALIRRLRAVDPVETLDSLLQELQLGQYPLLHGKAFEVTVGTGSDPGHSVQLMTGAGVSTRGGQHVQP